ncbi:acyltransferase [Amylibacter sp.]|nr:acyltransferase [Amylibacter sp.]
MTRLVYRPEVDGLRAIAVILVIFFHAGYENFRYGFVGVDMFFVISGYVISRTVLYQIDNKTFSIFDFYNRRARRILPLVLSVIITFSVVFYKILLPWEYENFAAETIATISFSNNIYHYITSANYWGVESDFKALIHTWSLAIEEQYYFLFPFFMLAFAHTKKYRILYITLITLSSLIAMVIYVHYNYMGSFFLLPFRAWEIFFGAAIALIENTKIRNSLINILLITSIFLIVLTISPQTGFISHELRLIGVVIGTGTLIFGLSKKSILKNLISSNTIKYIGTLSFSLYMWHQPIFVFGRLNSLTKPLPNEYLILIIITLILSILSKHVIEDSFRNKKFVSDKIFYVGLTITTVFVTAVSYQIFATGGLPNRWSSKITVSENGRNANVRFNNSVNDTYFLKEFPDNGKSNILVLGNSFARDFLNVLNSGAKYQNNNISYYYETPICNSEDLNTLALKLPENHLNNADYIIFASSEYMLDCSTDDLKRLTNLNDIIVLILGTKSFGYSTYANITQLPKDNLGKSLKTPANILEINKSLAEKIGLENFIDIQSLSLNDEGNIIVFDPTGNLVSFDTRHLTKAGAEHLAPRWLGHSKLRDL